jgi:hypothetical protein
MLIATLKCKSRSFSSRFVLLFFGTLLLALMNFRSYAMFFIAGIPAFGYCVKNIQPSITVTEKEEKGGKGRKALAIVVVLVLAVVCGFVISNSDSDEEAPQPEQAVTAYDILDDFCEILEPEKDNLVLNTAMNTAHIWNIRAFIRLLMRARSFSLSAITEKRII